MGKNALKLSTLIGEIFEICWFKIAENALKFSTRVGEKFEIYLSQMAKNMHLNCPSWLEKILNFTCLKLSELHNFQAFQGVVFKYIQRIFFYIRICLYTKNHINTPSYNLHTFVTPNVKYASFGHTPTLAEGHCVRQYAGIKCVLTPDKSGKTYINSSVASYQVLFQYIEYCPFYRQISMISLFFVIFNHR